MPITVKRQNGTGTLIATTTMTYDARGRLATTDGPLGGVGGDVTAYRYDDADQLIGLISPDPDGTGALKNRAIKLTYRPDGQVSVQELGTVPGQTDADWALFNQAQRLTTGYDSNSRPVTRKLSKDSTDYALTQTNYDALGRVNCTAVRMDPAQWASQTNACVPQTNGAFGPDRIGQTVYDEAGEVTQRKVAVGTADAAIERTLDYTGNGQLKTLKDAENNLTTYEYDGFDRLSKTRYPLPAKGANASSTTDYEQLTYDSNGNVTARQLRDGSSLGFTYDNLDRVTNKTVPGDPNVSYSYDNLGRLLSASASGNAAAFTYDALSRKLTEGSTVGGTTLTSTLTYDAADRLSTIAYPAGGGALTISYTYLTTGELLTVNQATLNLAIYGYDNLGRRTSATFENGTAQAFGWDPVSRLASLTNDLSGTANDLSVTFAYNPASQIIQTVRTGDAYAYTAQGSGSTAYTANGLNQQISIDGVAATWDAKGNLATEPQSNKAYCYSAENLLKRVSTIAGTCASPSATLAYDPLLRLSQVTGSGTTRFAYNGVDAVAEYDGSGNLTKRFVIDPTTGAPLMEFAGSGTGTSFHRFYGADERGSIISNSDISGNVVGLNRYDEYGKPQSTNIGRYQYTGQKWIGEAGLYDYKARDYLPHLGIFAQPDPVEYEDNANLYAYVSNDPVNLVDPLGLDEAITCIGEMNCGGGLDLFDYGRRPPPPCPQSWVCVDGRRRPPTPAPYNGSGTITGNPAKPPVSPQPAPKKTKPKSKSYDPDVNYCGGEGGTALPNAVGGVSINDICYAHDVCYGASGTPKATCDANFGVAIFTRLEIYLIVSDPFFRTAFAAVGGLLGYEIVNLGGRSYYVPR